MALLDVQGLTVQLQTQRGPADAVRAVSFSLERGQTLGLIGESGCGKSITALALMGLLPESARATGRIRFDGRELLDLPDAGWQAVRGNRIGMVFQEPMTALNPLHTVAHQVAEPLMLHQALGAAAARARAIGLLERVGIADAARRADAYPHQFSGGQRQRITIAMALACEPDLLIADEPTTALDVTVQEQILDLIADLVQERGMALLLISHDLGVIAQNVQRMMVMYGGLVVEQGSTSQVLRDMAHPYTRGLFGARPRLGAARGSRLDTIEGSVPELADLPPGCPFSGRCRHALPGCAQQPVPTRERQPGHQVRCLRLDELAGTPGMANAA